MNSRYVMAEGFRLQAKAFFMLIGPSHLMAAGVTVTERFLKDFPLDVELENFAVACVVVNRALK